MTDAMNDLMLDVAGAVLDLAAREMRAPGADWRNAAEDDRLRAAFAVHLAAAVRAVVRDELQRMVTAPAIPEFPHA